MTLALSSYTVPWAIGIPGQQAPEPPLTPHGLLDLASELGVGRIQIADNLPVEDLPEPQRRRLFDAARERGVAIELGMRGTEPAAVERYIAVCRECEATVLRTVPTMSVVPGDASGERTAVEALTQAARAVLPSLVESGVVLCIENYEALSVAALKTVIESVDSPHVRVCLDTVNSLGRGEGVRSVLDALGPLTGNLHIKDFATSRLDHRLGFLIEGRAAGAGQLPIAELLSAVPKDVSVVLELWTPWQGDIESTVATERDWARRSVRFLRAAGETEGHGPGWRL